MSDSGLRFNFGSIVVVEDVCIGVVCKCWDDKTYEVYVRHHNSVWAYAECEIQPYVYDKALLDNGEVSDEYE